MRELASSRLFDSRAYYYAKYRPSYPAGVLEIFQRLVCPPADAADIAAGTGILSRMLAATGYRTVALEPNPFMRGKLTDSACQGLRVIGGGGAFGRLRRLGEQARRLPWKRLVWQVAACQLDGAVDGARLDTHGPAMPQPTRDGGEDAPRRLRRRLLHLDDVEVLEQRMIVDERVAAARAGVAGALRHSQRTAAVRATGLQHAVSLVRRLEHGRRGVGSQHLHQEPRPADRA